MVIMDSITSIAIFTTAVGRITATSTATRIARDNTAVTIVTPAMIIVIFTVTDDIGAATISMATIGPMAEAIIATNLQAGFTPTRQDGMDLDTAKQEVAR